MEHFVIDKSDPKKSALDGGNHGPDILVAGIGSSQGEDQFGWWVASELTQRSLKNCRVRIAATPLQLLNWIEDCTVLHVIDACRGSGPSGKIYRWLWPCSEIQTGEWSGTHNFDLPNVLILAQLLKLLPDRVVVWGIETTAFDKIDDFPSKEVLQSIHSLADRIQSELSQAN